MLLFLRISHPLGYLFSHHRLLQSFCSLCIWCQCPCTTVVPACRISWLHPLLPMGSMQLLFIQLPLWHNHASSLPAGSFTGFSPCPRFPVITFC